MERKEYTLTLTLTRWHRAAERLNQQANEYFKAARRGYLQTRLLGTGGEAQAARLREDATHLASQLQKGMALQDAAFAVRAALGEANARAGVNQAVTEVTRLSRRCAVLREIVLGQTSDMVAIDEIAEFAALPSDSRWSGGDILVQMLDATGRAELERELVRRQVELYAASDRANDLNRATLTLTLPYEAAAVAGFEPPK